MREIERVRVSERRRKGEGVGGRWIGRKLRCAIVSAEALEEAERERERDT